MHRTAFIDSYSLSAHLWGRPNANKSITAMYGASIILLKIRMSPTTNVHCNMFAILHYTLHFLQDVRMDELMILLVFTQRYIYYIHNNSILTLEDIGEGDDAFALHK